MDGPTPVHVAALQLKRSESRGTRLPTVLLKHKDEIIKFYANYM